MRASAKDKICATCSRLRKRANSYPSPVLQRDSSDTANHTMLLSDSNESASLNQLLHSAEHSVSTFCSHSQSQGGNPRTNHVSARESRGDTSNSQRITADSTAGSDEISSLQSLMDRSDNLLSQIEAANQRTASPSRDSSGHRSVTRETRSQDKDSSDDSDDISIVGETPGTGSASALDSLGNFSLGSLFGAGGEFGRSDSPGGQGGSPRDRSGRSARSAGSIGQTSASSYPPPSATYGSMASMAHHMMASPYMAPGWGFPMWNPAAGMSVPMPPSGPSLQHTDSTTHSRRSHRSHSSHQHSGREGRVSSQSDPVHVSDNTDPTPRTEERDTDSPHLRSGESSSSSSLPPPPPFMGMPPHYMPYSYPPYSYPYLGMPPPPPAHSGGDSSRSGYSPYHSMSPFPPGGSYPGASSVSWNNIPTGKRTTEDKDSKSDE